ncbi:MAG: hypothetical protein R2784_20330, partial [Saprospiraceae bacterium]
MCRYLPFCGGKKNSIPQFNQTQRNFIAGSLLALSLLSLSSFAPVQDSFFKETIKDFHKVVFHKALKTLNTSTTETTLGQEAFMAPCPGGSG